MKERLGGDAGRCRECTTSIAERQRDFLLGKSTRAPERRFGTIIAHMIAILDAVVKAAMHHV